MECHRISHGKCVNACKKVELVRIGCFNVNPHRRPWPLPELLFTDLDRTSDVYSGIPINLDDTDSHMTSLICRCAFQALYMGYTTIGLQHYGECWSGKNSEMNYARDGPSRYCITWGKSRCRNGADCIGEDGANFVYKVSRECYESTVTSACPAPCPGACAPTCLPTCCSFPQSTDPQVYQGRVYILQYPYQQPAPNPYYQPQPQGPVYPEQFSPPTWNPVQSYYQNVRPLENPNPLTVPADSTPDPSIYLPTCKPECVAKCSIECPRHCCLSMLKE